MIFAGIDPGVTGALAFLSEGGQILYAEQFSTLPYNKSRRQIDCAQLARRLSALREPGVESVVTVEEVHAFPKQGVSSTFTFGMTFGQILGVIETLGLRYQLAHPRRWQKFLYAGMNGEPKKLSILAAHRLWPALSTNRDGLTDALLIAEYGRRAWKANP